MASELPPGEILPSSATPDDLEAHPGLSRLLRALGGLLGLGGTSPALHRDLQQAEQGLGRARGLWLHLELLRGLLGELIRDPRDLQPQVVRGLEQELSWAQLRRGPPEISQLLPPPQPPKPLPGLIPELERRLRERRNQILDFLLGPPKTPQNPPKTPQNPPKNSQNPPKNSQNPKIPQNQPKNPQKLGVLLEAERLRLLRERLRERLLREELDRMGWKYPQVLSRCVSLLCRGHALGALQAHLDEGRGRYLLAKGGAVLLKSRLEELRVLLDTYPAPTVEAHRRIRAGLSERLRAAEAEAAILGAELSSLRALGPEFRQLALEFGQIRQESAQKRWALRQLRPLPP